MEFFHCAVHVPSIQIKNIRDVIFHSKALRCLPVTSVVGYENRNKKFSPI